MVPSTVKTHQYRAHRDIYVIVTSLFPYDQKLMLRKIKAKVFSLAAHPHAEYYFFILCFIEAFMLPIPTTVMQAPMTWAHPHRVLRYTWIATVGSVLGGILGYCIGRLFFSLVEPYITGSSYNSEFLQIQQWMLHWGLWILFPLALCPIPFKITTISSGLLGMLFVPFLMIISIARLLHFFLIGYLLEHSQKKFRSWVMKRYT